MKGPGEDGKMESNTLKMDARALAAEMLCQIQASPGPNSAHHTAGAAINLPPATPLTNHPNNSNSNNSSTNHGNHGNHGNHNPLTPAGDANSTQMAMGGWGMNTTGVSKVHTLREKITCFSDAYVILQHKC